MKKAYFLVRILIVYLFFISSGFAAKSSYFDKGKILFDQKNFEKSKTFFERDIVFNPKNAIAYLYLAKIFKNSDNDEEEEKNLKGMPYFFAWINPLAFLLFDIINSILIGKL